MGCPTRLVSDSQPLEAGIAWGWGLEAGSWRIALIGTTYRAPRRWGYRVLFCLVLGWGQILGRIQGF